MDTMEESLSHRVIIIDGMAVLNSISKTENIKTCQDLANVFIQMISNMSKQYDEVRLVFDRYISTSLKEQMKTKRTKGKSTYFHVKDNTLIQDIFLRLSLRFPHQRRTDKSIWLTKLLATTRTQTMA